LAGNNLAKKPSFAMAMSSNKFQTLVNNTLGDPERGKRFIASIVSAVAVNPALQECTHGTILAGALLGESLNLPPSPQLGLFYLVPFKQKAKWENGVMVSPECVNAVFVLGYKGYLQLAMRSGQYLDIDVLEIREGEYKGRDNCTGQHKFSFIEDDDLREELPVIGYMAYFEYLNGFRKVLYWSKEKMMSHANRYSPAFSARKYTDLVNGRIAGLTLQMIEDGVYIADKDLWKTANSMSSFWYKSFDGMAKKTMIRQLIGKWGVMSAEFITAVERDNAVIEMDGGFTPEPKKKLPSASIPTDEFPPPPPPNVVPEMTDVVESINLEDM
jgi:recombination protein RecT